MRRRKNMLGYWGSLRTLSEAFPNLFIKCYRIIYTSLCYLYPEVFLILACVLVFLLFQNGPPNFSKFCPELDLVILAYLLTPLRSILFWKCVLALPKVTQLSWFGCFDFLFLPIIHICATRSGIELAKPKLSLAWKGTWESLTFSFIIFLITHRYAQLEYTLRHIHSCAFVNT